MAISLGDGAFSVPTMPDELISNVSGSVSGLSEYLMETVSDLPGWLPMAAVAALILGPFALVAAYVVLFATNARSVMGSMGSSGGSGVAGALMS